MEKKKERSRKERRVPLNGQILLKHITTAVCILAGNALLAFIVVAFVVPHKIITGGTTGIGIVFHQFYPEISISFVVLVLNTVLLLLGRLILGRKFAATTVASSFLYPTFLESMREIPGIETLTDDSLMAAIFAGCLMGIALGLVMRVGSSTGGIDIVVLIIHKYTHISVGGLVNLCDLMVLGFQAFFSTSESILLGIILLVLNSMVLDRIMVAGKSQIQLYIISRKTEEIRNFLLTERLFCTLGR